VGEPDARARGLGGLAVEALVAPIVRSVAGAVAVDVWAQNRRAIRCYERHGLAVTARLPRWRVWQGFWRDHVLMTAGYPRARPSPPPSTAP